jgi:hypothetical protein
MRQYVLYAMAVIFPVSLGIWFFWLLGKSFVQIYNDWQLEKELIEIEAQSQAHREERKRLNTKRLDTGCDHDFETIGHGLPPNACSKCGMEREKPQGACDHIWKRKAGAAPSSFCERCGKVYSPTAETRTPR